MAKNHDVLIIDDDRAIVESLSALYRDHGFSPQSAGSGSQALELTKLHSYNLIILDLGLPDIDGLELFQALKANGVNTPVIIVSGQATIKKAIEATKLGAFNIVEKPPDPAGLLLDSQNAVRQYELESEVDKLRKQLLSQNDMVGESDSMRQLREKLSKIALSDSRVFIYGEPGAGKEMAARYLHFSSARATGPFVAVNCAAIPGELFESELFGHERGAFTGAVASRKGRFELADGGTLFLDEVAELRPEHQAKLLRAIETSVVQRLGSMREIKVDVRIVSASNKDLHHETKEGRFREDLYFRLNVIPVMAPPLRERPDDIPLLARHFLDSLGYARLRLDPGAIPALAAYNWPGNVRELRNIIERAAALAQGEILTDRDIKDAIAGSDSKAAEPKSAKPISFREHTGNFEKALLGDALRQANGNIAEAARILKMDRGNLSKRLKKFGLTGI
jgi:two-component system, NtrC family, nitrogen regulation response regulator NtrX